ncbi:MAG: septum formation initiator family protein [Bacilli bacterium]|nr:septum formation initiator family protein [Bacilli bacterium]
MPKRRISKASKRRLTIFGTISLIAIVYFGFSLLYNIYTIYDLTSEKKNLENLYVELQEEAESLKIDIEKLNDQDYLANYAREHYLYSKDGEYIIQIDDIEEIEDDISNEINKNYIILGLSTLMIFIFIYIISKGKKKKRKK